MTNAAHERVRTVRIGAGVKQIVMVAGRVRSIATNAILLAHRVGDLARGFGVLSRELRGAIYQGKDVGRFIDGFDHLEVGITQSA